MERLRKPETLLALTDYEVPDLLPMFLPGRGTASDEYDDYRSVLLPYVRVAEDPWMASGWGRGSGAGFGGRSTRVPSVRQGMASVQGMPAARERFETTPIFLADLAADASGTARTKAPLPDNLTTFRIFAVASARVRSEKLRQSPSERHHHLVRDRRPADHPDRAVGLAVGPQRQRTAQFRDAHGGGLAVALQDHLLARVQQRAGAKHSGRHAMSVELHSQQCECDRQHRNHGGNVHAAPARSRDGK